jgi:hypothetical protein
MPPYDRVILRATLVDGEHPTGMLAGWVLRHG